MKPLLSAVTGLLLLASCTTVDVEKRVKDTGAGPQKEDPVSVVPIDIPPEPVVIEIERPIYIPEPSPASGTSRSSNSSQTAQAAQQTVRSSNSDGIVRPSEYSRAAMIYDYDPDCVYEIYTQPLRVTDIRLEPGEKAVETPFISDSERWMLGAGIHFDNGQAVQHIYIKPTVITLTASLVINTDRRVYHLILRSYPDIHMPMIRWRYPLSGLPHNYIVPLDTGAADRQDIAGIDPRFLSFNYRITYGLFQKPRWLPELVYDDGKKTYITFPEKVLQRELPAVFANRDDVVNYRVAGNLIIIDGILETVTVKMDDRKITIEKKRG
jgi:type IV secretion system protein VirB9